MKKFFVSLVLGALVQGCVAASELSAEPMSLAECAEASVCRIEGTLGLLEVDHVVMGRLELTNGECVNVSLPRREVRRIELEGPQRTTVEGRVYRSPGDDPDIMNLTVNGRRIGWHQCGDFYLFVER